MWNLHRLRLLRELQLRGTIAEVARTLRFSPSTVSHQLDKLENEVGAVLLVPDGRRVRLTPYGNETWTRTVATCRVGLTWRTSCGPSTIWTICGAFDS